MRIRLAEKQVGRKWLEAAALVEDMVDARSSLDNNGLPAVLVTLNSAGGQRMLQFTTENVN